MLHHLTSGAMPRCAPRAADRQGWRSLLAVASVALSLLASRPLAAQTSMAIADDQVSSEATFATPILLTNTIAVRAFSVAVVVNPAVVEPTGVSISGTITEAVGAESVVFNTYANGATLEVTLDQVAPFDGQVIPTGTAQFIGEMEWQPTTVLATPIAIDFDFLDDVLGDPTVSNFVVNSLGATIGIAQGLVLNSGEIVMVPGTLELSIVSTSVAEPDLADVAVVLSNDIGPCNAFVLAISHEAGISLEAIDLFDTATEVANPEFVASEVQSSGGLLRVIFDFEAPFDGHALAMGDNATLAHFIYECSAFPAGPDPETVHAIEFVDGVIGFPPADNLVTVLGYSLHADTTDGTVTCQTTWPPFLRSDCNDDGVSNLADAINMLNVLFFGFPLPNCTDSCDSNADGIIDIADYIYLVSYLFLDGPVVIAPYPNCHGMPGILCESMSCI